MINMGSHGPRGADPDSATSSGVAVLVGVLVRKERGVDVVVPPVTLVSAITTVPVRSISPG